MFDVKLMGKPKRLKAEDLRRKLRHLLNNKQLIRVIEVHNGASSLVANEAKIEVSKNGQTETLLFNVTKCTIITK